MCQLPHGAAWITHSRRFLPSHSLMNWPIAGTNPFQFRMELLHKHPRHQQVLQVAAEAAGYGRNLPEGRALGIAVQESFGSIALRLLKSPLDPMASPLCTKSRRRLIVAGWSIRTRPRPR